jgi:hypothetical protein
VSGRNIDYEIAAPSMSLLKLERERERGLAKSTDSNGGNIQFKSMSVHDRHELLLQQLPLPRILAVRRRRQRRSGGCQARRFLGECTTNSILICFQQTYAANPLGLYMTVRQCLEQEMKIVQQVTGKLASSGPLKFPGKWEAFLGNLLRNRGDYVTAGHQCQWARHGVFLKWEPTVSQSIIIFFSII